MTTRTRERTKVETKTEQIMEVECINCNDYYPEKEIYPMQINEDYENNICEFCANSMYNYKSQTSKRYNAIKTLDNVDYKELWIKNGITLLIMSFGISLFIASIILTLDVVSTPNSPFATAMNSTMSPGVMIAMTLVSLAILHSIGNNIG